ncbi:MAG: hypothetical protein K2Q26_05600 [Bdellovibrionales bacterium]|nr:hypothetical protein [Bdellovibrionales bacterium]
MLKRILAASVMFFSMNAFAATSIEEVTLKIQKDMLAQAVSRALEWKVGDTNNYKLDMGFIQGTMVMAVRSYDSEGIWMTQDVELGFAGKQNMETLIDPNTGAVLKLLVNGKEQEPPKQEIEVIEIVDANITVPAGTFNCMHIRLMDKTQNQEVNVWQTTSVPLSGMIKTVQPSQLGQVTIELTSFTKIP